MSIPNPSRQILGVISVRDAEELLFDWANLPGQWPIRWSRKRPSTPTNIGQRFADAQRQMRRRWHEKLLGKEGVWTGVIGNLWHREMLRRAWDSQDPREREWLCFRLRDHFAALGRWANMTPRQRRKEMMDLTGPAFSAPPVTPFEAAIFHFQRQGKRVRHCPNADCLAPYFFASKKNQQYCSPECARPARLESQRRWAREHPGKKRRRRKKKGSRKRPAPNRSQWK
jgi:hypothetical protein